MREELMMVSGGMGWKLPAIADVVVEDKIRHADPIGTVTMTCPADTVPRRMNCYRLASGPFGTHRAPHSVCSSLRRDLDGGQSGQWRDPRIHGADHQWRPMGPVGGMGCPRVAGCGPVISRGMPADHQPPMAAAPRLRPSAARHSLSPARWRWIR